MTEETQQTGTAGLRVCPFCGGSALDEGWKIVCSVCGSRNYFGPHAWNTRATDAALEQAQAERDAALAEVAKLKRPNLFWIDEDPETGYCDPWEAAETSLYSCGDEGVAAIREGRELGVRYYARLRPDDELGIDDDWLKDFDTEAEAEKAIADERSRRAALAAGEGS